MMHWPIMEHIELFDSPASAGVHWRNGIGRSGIDSQQHVRVELVVGWILQG
jgi:hypothetical protein